VTGDFQDPQGAVFIGDPSANIKIVNNRKIYTSRASK
jgi:hypothetical protein